MNTVNDTIMLTPLDGPTVLIEMGSTRFLVDPTFDSPQEYPIGSRVLAKTTRRGRRNRSGRSMPLQ